MERDRDRNGEIENTSSLVVENFENISCCTVQLVLDVTVLGSVLLKQESHHEVM